MKTKLLLSFLFTFVFYLMSSQVPQGFNYQAVARNSQGKELLNTALQVKVSILTDTTGFYATGGGTYIWEELQNVTTNSFGLFTILFGAATASKVQGSAASFSAIDWKASPLYIGTKIYYTGAWKYLGTTKLGSVPYSMVAGAVSSLSKLNVKGTATSPDSALFEVKNLNGQTVFAVYNEGIRAYVDNGIMKGATKGGFAIGGFGTAKAPSQPYLMISPDSARIYVDETVKGTKGGFAIGGFNTAKGTVKEFMLITPSNYFIGHNSGQKITSATYNATMGYETAKALTTGANNVFIGYQSGWSDVDGSSNVFIGMQAGYSNTGGLYNIALGRGAGYTNNASSNIFLGDLTAYFNTTGSQNVMIGDWAGYHNTIGDQNVFLGAQAGWSNTTGANNIFEGYNAGYSNTIGHDNIAIGNTAGENNLDGNYNVMMGTNAGNKNITGDYNTLIGYQAGENLTGFYGTMLGYHAGNASTSGASQTMIGYEAGVVNTGSYNTFVGTLAGGNSGSGGDNTYVGLAAGDYATGSRNVFIGKWAGYGEATSSDKLIISNNYTLSDNFNNALIYGDFSSKYLRVNGSLTSTSLIASDDTPGVLGQHNVTANWGVGVKGVGAYIGVRGESTFVGTGTRYGVYGVASGGAANYAGYFSGNVYATGTITQLSDKNYKKNILPLNGSLQKVLNLQGVSYEWKSDSELALLVQTKSGDAKAGDSQPLNLPKGTQIGVIAQDVEMVIPELVQTDPNGFKSVDYIKIVPLLIEGMKDQQKMINAQAKRIDDLEKTVNLLLNQKK